MFYFSHRWVLHIVKKSIRVQAVERELFSYFHRQIVIKNGGEYTILPAVFHSTIILLFLLSVDC